MALLCGAKGMFAYFGRLQPRTRLNLHTSIRMSKAKYSIDVETAKALAPMDSIFLS